MVERENLLKEWFLSDVNKELEINSLKNRIKELEEKLREKGNVENSYPETGAFIFWEFLA